MHNELFIISIFFHAVSVVFFLKNDKKGALIFLLLGGIILRFYFIQLDSFINDWDERFHALVAKNLSHHWLTPTLIDKPFLPYNYQKWEQAYIWLHKQPFFLWQMALSIKFFGANEFAVRFPSLVMTSVLIVVIYRMAELLFTEKIAFLSAFIFSCYQPILDLNSGILSTDHNDIAFLFYVTLSVYCWVCFEKKKGVQYLYLMGFFSGLAILNKWLTGLMVYSSFTFYHLFFIQNFFTKETIKDLLKSAIVCLATFLPWQVYILCRFPLEAHFEYYYNSLHLIKAVEGHSGDSYYYIDLLADQYKHLQLFIFIGILVCVATYNKSRMALSLVCTVIAVYVFFSLVPTKLPYLIIMIMPVNIILLAVGLDFIIGWLEKFDKAIVFIKFTFFMLLFYVFVDFDAIYFNHMDDANWRGYARAAKSARVRLYRKLALIIPKDAVIVNFPPCENIDCMFYTGNICYPEITENDFKLLRREGHRILFISDTLPKYAKQGNAKLVKDVIAGSGYRVDTCQCFTQ
jgi:4-amino-4-deoxy-L-arabinose transferase-like glycosyltransferase